jgi:hypothetical protein
MIILKIVLKIIFTNIDIFKIKPKNKIKKIFKIFLDVVFYGCKILCKPS